MKIKRNEGGFIQSVKITEKADTWSMDCSLATIIHAHIKKFRKTTKSHPISLTEEAWDQKLKKMQKAFKYISKEKHLGVFEEKEFVEEGLDLFREYYFHLWS